MARTTHGEGQDHGDDEDDDGVIRIEQLKAVILHAVVGIGPGAPSKPRC